MSSMVRVLAQHLPFHHAQTVGLRPFDHEAHEVPPKAQTLEVGPQQNAVFAGFVVGIRVQTDRAEHFAALRIERHECDRARIIELRQACEKHVVEIAHRRKKAQAQILLRDAFEEFQKLAFVLRPAPDERMPCGRCEA